MRSDVWCCTADDSRSKHSHGGVTDVTTPNADPSSGNNTLRYTARVIFEKDVVGDGTVVQDMSNGGQDYENDMQIIEEIPESTLVNTNQTTDQSHAEHVIQATETA